MAQVIMSAGAAGGVIQGEFGTYIIGPSGLVTVDSRDVSRLLALGMAYITGRSNYQQVPTPRGATAARIVASVNMANGTLTIANQPDTPRQLAVRVDPSSVAITGGLCTITYPANDGTTQVDALSLATPANTVLTINTSKGAMRVTSAVVSGLAGGATPKIEIADTNFLALPVDQGFANFALLKENVGGADEALGTVNASAAAVSPTTAPNGTNIYGFGYSYAAPNI